MLILEGEPYGLGSVAPLLRDSQKNIWGRGKRWERKLFGSDLNWLCCSVILGQLVTYSQLLGLQMIKMFFCLVLKSWSVFFFKPGS